MIADVKLVELAHAYALTNTNTSINNTMNNYSHVKLISTTQLAIIFLWLLLSSHGHATPLPTNFTDTAAVMKQATFGAGAPDSRPDIFQR